MFTGAGAGVLALGGSPIGSGPCPFFGVDPVVVPVVDDGVELLCVGGCCALTGALELEFELLEFVVDVPLLIGCGDAGFDVLDCELCVEGEVIGCGPFDVEVVVLSGSCDEVDACHVV